MCVCVCVFQRVFVCEWESERGELSRLRVLTLGDCSVECGRKRGRDGEVDSREEEEEEVIPA